MAGYGGIAKIYDGEYRDFSADIELYLRLLSAERFRGPVVELGCGTGRVSLPLVRAGYRVTGVDISPAMLARARRRRRALPPEEAMRLRFSLQDMTAFSFPRRFRAAVIAFSTLALVTEPGGRASCLERVGRHLEPGGLLLVDLPQPRAEIADEVEARISSRFRIPPWGHEIDKLVEERPSSDHRLRQVRYSYTVRRWRDDAVIDRLEVRFALARLDRNEVEAALTAAGFDVEAVLGDYRGNRLGPRSPRMIFAARRL
jgi:SAM-dependent methyltransferase